MTLVAEERAQLLRIAREAVVEGLDGGKPSMVPLDRVPPALGEIRASFVTLHRHGELRGCIGTLAPALPLAHDVATRAHSAAFADPRFMRVRREELAALDFHIAVLGSPRALDHTNEDQLLAQLNPGEHGLLIRKDTRRATFLPAVWESIAEPHRFLRELKRKAGIAADETDFEALVYRAESFPD